jgi:hypothetical protein
LKLFAAVHEAVSNAYPDKEVPNKITVHRLVTKFQVVALSLIGWWTFSASAIKLLCKFFLTIQN